MASPPSSIRVTKFRDTNEVEYPPIAATIPNAPKTSMVDFVKRYPFVTLGMATTTVVLGIGMSTILSNNRVLGQHMMRARVLAQGATLVCLGLSGIQEAVNSSRNPK